MAIGLIPFSNSHTSPVERTFGPERLRIGPCGVCVELLGSLVEAWREFLLLGLRRAGSAPR